MSFEEWQRQFDEPVSVPVVEKPTDGFAAWEAQLDAPISALIEYAPGELDVGVGHGPADPSTPHDPLVTDVPDVGPGFFGKTKIAYQRGKQATDIDFLWNDVVDGKITEEEALAATQEYQQMIQKDPIVAGNWASEIWYTTAGMLPAMIEGTIAGAKVGTVAAGAAAVAGQAGPQVLAPEEIVTVPGAYIAGQAVGSTYYWAKQGRGAIYRQAREANVDPKIAAYVASIGGPAYGAIEQSQLDRVIPGLARLKSGLFKIAVGFVKNVGVQTLEEGGQRVVTDGAVMVGKLIEREINIADVPKETKQIAKNAWSEMKQAIGPMVLLQLPGASISATKGAVVRWGDVPLTDVPTTAKMAADEQTTEPKQETIDTVVGKVPVPALENIQNLTPIQTSVADRNVKLRIGHDVAKKMGMEGEEFEAYKQTYGGQSSMADMTDEQLDGFLQQIQQDGTDAGLTAKDVAITMTPTEELIKQAKASRGYKETTELQRSLRGTVRKKADWVIDKWHGYWKVQDRVRNIARVLDNYEDGGPFQRLLWDPIKGVRTRKEQSWNGMLRGMQMTWAEAGVNVGTMMDTKRNDIIITKDGEGMPRSHADFIGLYLISKDKKNRVRTSAWFTNNNIDSTKTWANIKELVESNEQMKLVADSVHAYFRDRGPVFVQTANDMGIKSISKDGASEDITLEQDYFPMLSENPDMVTDEDIVDVFEERYSQHLQIPGKQHTKKRTGGDEKTEWNVFRNLARVSNKMESLIEVGPVAQQVYKMVSDKKVRRAINNATNGKGATIIDKWIRDSARGTSTYNITSVEKIVANMRTNSVQYTLGLKLFTSAPKAILSLVNGLANNPAMIPSVFGVLLEYRTLSGLNKIKNEVYSKSDIMQNRDPVRDIRTMWNDKTIKKFFAGKNVSPLNLRYWTFLDKATANAVWMGAYRLAKTKMGEMDARKWADTRAQESQPMASVEDLPDIFRGSELGKTLTTFMGMLNTTQQYLKHDIIGEYKAGKISGQKATYRFMMGEVVPALILGVITRGRLPETPREMLEDVISYLLSPAVFLGRFIFQAGRMSIDAALGVKSKSYDPVKSGISLIPLRAFEEAARLGVAIGKGEGADIVEKAASTFGAGTGLLPEQGVITARGAYDLATGVTTDWWRLTRTEGNLKYNAPAKRPGARRKRSGQKSRRQARSRRD